MPWWQLPLSSALVSWSLGLFAREQGNEVIRLPDLEMPKDGTFKGGPVQDIPANTRPVN